MMIATFAGPVTTHVFLAAEPWITIACLVTLQARRMESFISLQKLASKPVLAALSTIIIYVETAIRIV